MLKIKLFEWLNKTFGEPRHGDVIEIVEKISRKDVKAKEPIVVEVDDLVQEIVSEAIFLITELSLSFQMKNQDEKLADPVNINLWKEELEKVTDNSVRAFHCETSDIYQSNPKQNMKGRSFLLAVKIFHKQEI